jgi:hypothetical protein
MADLLDGRVKTTEQASAMLPPALFVTAMKHALNSRR